MHSVDLGPMVYDRGRGDVDSRGTGRSNERHSQSSKDGVIAIVDREEGNQKIKGLPKRRRRGKESINGTVFFARLEIRVRYISSPSIFKLRMRFPGYREANYLNFIAFCLNLLRNEKRPSLNFNSQFFSVQQLGNQDEDTRTYRS